ncbi:MAG: homoserine dehydrogenase, partial [Pseudomonadota bacterium]
MSAPLRIGIAGLGTVGAGVVRLLQTHGSLLEMRAGRPLRITAVSARRREVDRGVDLSGYAWVEEPSTLAGRDDVDLVVEVIGGEGAAAATIRAAVAAQKPAVTANKALLAAEGVVLAAEAEAAGTVLRFEASVAGGIPIVKALREGL